jgi:hypothetical protein
MARNNRFHDSASAGKLSGKRLYIHLGTHKTGSSSIQLMLREASDHLAEKGTKVIHDHPGHRVERTNCSSIAHAFIRSELFTPSRINGGQPADFGSNEVIDYFIGEITESDCESFIISAEAFCYLRTRAERKLLERNLRKLNCTVIPLVYFRSLPAWQKSWKAQLTKMPKTHEFMKLNSQKFTLLDDWYFDRDTIADFWRSISPHLVVVDYDRRVAEDRSVIPSFLDIVGLPRLENNDRYFRNKSVSLLSLANRRKKTSAGDVTF